MKKITFLLLMLFMAIGMQAQETENPNNLKVGDKMPAFALESAVYGNLSSADLQGKVVLISLFATWCGPCQKELAEVEKTLWPMYKNNPDFKLVVLGREHTEEQLKVYNEKKMFTFPLYPDPKREVYAMFADKTIPRAYLINKQGEVVYASIGFRAEEFAHLMELIAAELKK